MLVTTATLTCHHGTEPSNRTVLSLFLSFSFFFIIPFSLSVSLSSRSVLPTFPPFMPHQPPMTAWVPWTTLLQTQEHTPSCSESEDESHFSHNLPRVSVCVLQSENLGDLDRARIFFARVVIQLIFLWIKNKLFLYNIFSHTDHHDSNAISLWKFREGIQSEWIQAISNHSKSKSSSHF